MDKGDATREYRRQQQSSSSSRRQASASATGGIPAVFPPSISGSTFENTQVNLFGLLSNSSIHFHSGHPNSYGRGAVDPRGEVNVGYSQTTATPQGSHEAGIPNAGTYACDCASSVLIIYGHVLHKVYKVKSESLKISGQTGLKLQMLANSCAVFHRICTCNVCSLQLFSHQGLMCPFKRHQIRILVLVRKILKNMGVGVGG